MEDWKYYALIINYIYINKILCLRVHLKGWININYIIIANILVFIVTMIYLGVTKHKIKKPNLKDFGTIVLRLFIVFHR